MEPLHTQSDRLDPGVWPRYCPNKSSVGSWTGGVGMLDALPGVQTDWGRPPMPANRPAGEIGSGEPRLPELSVTGKVKRGGLWLGPERDSSCV